MPLMIGQVLQNRYHIQALLGQGGMGAVYRAFDSRLQKTVAVKENTLAVPGISPQLVAAARQQFEREALILAQLRHPNLAVVTDHFVEPNGNQYLVMDYVEGQDLAQILAYAGTVSPAQAVAWISQVCRALEYLHSQQPAVIHRDVKPQNIKVTAAGQVFLVDFGIAKIGDNRTLTGAAGITPGYSPPEQYRQSGTDARSDIYALGATLYALLTGQTPPESLALLDGSERLTPPRQLNAAVPPALEQATLRAMQVRKTDRPQTAAQFRQMLAPKAQKPGFSQKPGFWPAVGGVGLVILFAIFVGIILSAYPPATPTPIAQIPPTTAVPATRAPAPPTWTPTHLPPAPPPTPACFVGATRVAEKDGMAQVCVPAGEFTMGSANSDTAAYDDEKPQHKVYLDAFWIDKTEVTNAQYKQCVRAGECAASSYANDSGYNGDTQPVVGVNWQDAVNYCAWAGRQLPTEAQWEKAARGTDGRIYPWGNEKATCEYAVMNDGSGNGCGKGSAAWPVGSKPKGASPYGALDMAGNVWEWVADWYDEKYYASSPDRNPTGPSSGQYRVLRGGKWSNSAPFVRAAIRYDYTADYRSVSVGFRCLVASGQ